MDDDTTFGKQLEVHVGNPTIEKLILSMKYTPESTGREIRTIRVHIVSPHDTSSTYPFLEVMVPRTYLRAAIRGDTQAYATWVNDRIYNTLLELGVVRGEKRLSYSDMLYLTRHR